MGFREEIIKHNPIDFFKEFEGIGDVLFFNAAQSKKLFKKKRTDNAPNYRL
jgi:hypothetical protein